jgi:hypothetical protein
VVVLLMTPRTRPSPWVQRFAGLIRPGGQRAGRGLRPQRSTLALVGRSGASRSPASIRDPAAALDLPPGARVLVADIENGPWPLPERRFDAVVVTNYLWRALWPALRGALADGGVLIYETFALGQETVGKPSRPDFLLASRGTAAGLHGSAGGGYEDGFEADVPRFVQRIVAVQARRRARRTGPIWAGRARPLKSPVAFTDLAGTETA